MSLEGVTKDIKDEREPMGKRETVVLNGWRKIWGLKNPGGVQLALYILLLCRTAHRSYQNSNFPEIIMQIAISAF